MANKVLNHAPATTVQPAAAATTTRGVHNFAHRMSGLFYPEFETHLRAHCNESFFFGSNGLQSWKYWAPLERSLRQQLRIAQTYTDAARERIYSSNSEEVLVVTVS